MGCCSSSKDASSPTADPNEDSSEPAIARKDSMIRPLVQSSHNEYVYNSFSLGYKQLGSGLNGAVRAVRHKPTGVSYALKSIRKRGLNERQIKIVKQEIEIMKQIDHPNIVKLIRTFEDKITIYLVMELCTGGEVHERLCHDGVFSEDRAAGVIRKVVSALVYLHSKGIAHRDIKLANIVYENEHKDAEVKLIDFGLSRKFGTMAEFEMMTTFVGTPSYMAPEVADTTIEYNAACDMWSVGIATYVMLCGRYPEKSDQTPYCNRENMGKYRVKVRYPSFVPAVAKNFMQKLLVKDSQQRMTAAEALQHRWLEQKADNRQNVIPAHVVNNLIHFSQQPAIKRVALMMLAHRMDSAALKQVRAVFQSVDTEKNGRISLTELKTALAHSTQPPMSAEDIEFIFRAVDQDSSGRIQYSEFIAAVTTQRELSEEDAKDLFHRLDLDNSGCITIENLNQFIGDKALVAEAIKMLSSSHSEGLDLTTFTALMLGREADVATQQRRTLKVVGEIASTSDTPCESDSDVINDTSAVSAANTGAHTPTVHAEKDLAK